MRLEISSRTGRFNLCSNEENVSCHICVYDDENNKIKYTNLRLDSEENPGIAYVEDAVYLLDECFKRMFIDTSREEKKDLLQFLKDNEEEIDKGSRKYRIEVLNKKIKKYQDEIGRLSKFI